MNLYSMGITLAGTDLTLVLTPCECFDRVLQILIPLKVKTNCLPHAGLFLTVSQVRLISMSTMRHVTIVILVLPKIKLRYSYWQGRHNYSRGTFNWSLSRNLRSPGIKFPCGGLSISPAVQSPPSFLPRWEVNSVKGESGPDPPELFSVLACPQTRPGGSPGCSLQHCEGKLVSLECEIPENPLSHSPLISFSPNKLVLVYLPLVGLAIGLKIGWETRVLVNCPSSQALAPISFKTEMGDKIFVKKVNISFTK